MPIIKNPKLIVGRSSSLNKEFVQVNFDIHFNTSEVNYSNGFYLRGYLYEINQGSDAIFQSFLGSLSNKPLGSAQEDQFVGYIFNEAYHPKGIIDSIVRSREWDFGSFAPGEEQFRAVISIVPRVQNALPFFIHTPEVSIDIG